MSNEDRITGQRAGIRWAIAFLHKRAGVYEHPMARHSVKESAKVLTLAAKALRTEEIPAAGWRDIATAPRDGPVILAVATYHSATRKFLRWDVWSDDMSNDHMDENVYSGWRIADATLWMAPPPPPDTEDDITAGLEALSEPIVAEWGEVKDRLNLGKED